MAGAGLPAGRLAGGRLAAGFFRAAGLRVAFAAVPARFTALVAPAGRRAAATALGLREAMLFEPKAFLAALALRLATVARLAAGRTRAPFFWRVLLTWDPVADLRMRRFDERLCPRRFIHPLAAVKQAEQLLVTAADTTSLATTDFSSVRA